MKKLLEIIGKVFSLFSCFSHSQVNTIAHSFGTNEGSQKLFAVLFCVHSPVYRTFNKVVWLHRKFSMNVFRFFQLHTMKCFEIRSWRVESGKSNNSQCSNFVISICFVLIDIFRIAHVSKEDEKFKLNFKSFNSKLRNFMRIWTSIIIQSEPTPTHFYLECQKCLHHEILFFYDFFVW